MSEPVAPAAGENFQCPHCGAGYERAYEHVAFRDKDDAWCSVCGEVMDRWNGSSIPHHRLVRRPAQPPMKGRDHG